MTSARPPYVDLWLVFLGISSELDTATCTRNEIHMPRYQEITRQVGDRSVGALDRARDVMAVMTNRFTAGGRRVENSRALVPAPLAKLQRGLPALPKLKEIVEANLELTSRILVAQNAATLKVLTAAAPAKRRLSPVKLTAK